jgi:hypothetical protein
VDQATRKEYSKFDKFEFLAAIKSICEMTFKRSSILAGFQEYGLVSYNPAIMLKKIKEYQPSPPLNPPSQPTTFFKAQIWTSITPLTARSLKK